MPAINQNLYDKLSIMLKNQTTFSDFIRMELLESQVVLTRLSQYLQNLLSNEDLIVSFILYSYQHFSPFHPNDHNIQTTNERFCHVLGIALGYLAKNAKEAKEENETNAHYARRFTRYLWRHPRISTKLKNPQLQNGIKHGILWNPEERIEEFEYK